MRMSGDEVFIYIEAARVVLLAGRDNAQKGLLFLLGLILERFWMIYFSKYVFRVRRVFFVEHWFDVGGYFPRATARTIASHWLTVYFVAGFAQS